MVVVAAVNYERLHGTLDTIEYVRIEKYKPTQKKQTWSNYFNCTSENLLFVQPKYIQNKLSLYWLIFFYFYILLYFLLNSLFMLCFTILLHSLVCFDCVLSASYTRLTLTVKFQYYWLLAPTDTPEYP